MVSLLDRVDSFKNIVTYMLLLHANYTTDIDFHNVDLLDDTRKGADKNINKNLHHIIFRKLSFKMKTVAYYRYTDSKLRLLLSAGIPIQNVILANLFVNVALINNYVRNFGATILSYIALLM
jgi:hypothetical protein